jgi:DNA polymerase III delta prime subunit
MNEKKQALASIFNLSKATTPQKQPLEQKQGIKRKLDKFDIDDIDELIQKPKIEESKSVLWVDKYRPKTISEMVGVSKTVGVETSVFFQSRKSHPYSSFQCLLISGPNGVGKSCFAEIMLKSRGFTNIIKFGPESRSTVKGTKMNDDSDEDEEIASLEIKPDKESDKSGFNVESLYAVVERLSSQRYKETAIILEDIDGFQNFSLAKFVKLLTLHKSTVKKKLAKFSDQKKEEIKEKLGQSKEKKKKTRKIDKNKIFGLPERFPIPLCTIVLTTSLIKPFADKKLARLKSNCVFVEMVSLKESFLQKLAQKIIAAEKITISEDLLKTTIESAHGDARKLVNLLQFGHESNPKHTSILVEDSENDTFHQDLFDSTKSLLIKKDAFAYKYKDSKGKRIKTIDIDEIEKILNCDLYLIPAMIRENYLSYITKYKQDIVDIDDLANIAENVSDGDVMCRSTRLADHVEEAVHAPTKYTGNVLTLAAIFSKLPAYLPSRGDLYLRFPKPEFGAMSLIKSKKKRWTLLYEIMNMWAFQPLKLSKQSFPCASFQTKDSWIHLSIGDKHWKEVVQILGLEKWSNELQLQDNGLRAHHFFQVMKALQTEIIKYEKNELETMIIAVSSLDIFRAPQEWTSETVDQDESNLVRAYMISSTSEKIEHGWSLADFHRPKMDKWIAKASTKRKNEDNDEEEYKEKDDGRPTKRRKLAPNQVITEHMMHASHYDKIGIAVPKFCAEYGLLTFEDIKEFSDLTSWKMG